MIALLLWVQDLEAIPSSPRVTLELRDATGEAALAELERASGVMMSHGGSADTRVTMSVTDAPFLEAFGELCKRAGWSFGRVLTARGEAIQAPDPFFDGPVRAYGVRGPALLTWHGLTTVDVYNFDDPSKPHKKTRYFLGLTFDPASHAREGENRAFRDYPVTAVLDDGSEIELRSDHDPSRFSSSEPTWQFGPREELEGKTVSLRVKLSIAAPTRTAKATLSWAGKQEAAAGAASVTTEEPTRKTERELEGFDFVDVQKHTLTVKVIAAEQSKRAGVDGVFAAHAATVVGKDGTRLRAALKTSNGMSGPPMGFRFDVTVSTRDAAFEPASVEFEWAEAYAVHAVTVTVEGAAFVKP